MLAHHALAVSRGTIPLYHMVQLGKTILWVAADLIAFYVLSVVEQVPAVNIALLLAGGLAWHGLSDFVVGRWLEGRSDERHSLAIIVGLAVPIASVAFVAALLLAVDRPLTALAAMMVSRTAYALFDVPHHALLGRMAGLNLPIVRIVGIRNLWGQAASLALGLCLAPVLGPVMSAGGLALVLGAVAAVSALLSMPIILLILRLWEAPSVAARAIGKPARHRAIPVVLALHFCATVIVGTATKLAIIALPPGTALTIFSVGRIIASLPLPVRWREGDAGRRLVISTGLLLASVVALRFWPGASSLFAFGLASGWVNLLTWVWLARATEHPRTFGIATMLAKAGLVASIAAASAFA